MRKWMRKGENTTTNYERINNCRICNSNELVEILNLGTQTVIDFPEKEDVELTKEPLELVMCKSCSLLQLRHSYNQEMLYKDYWYESSISPSMVKALADVVDKATHIVELKDSDIVLDIASNDNTLLRQYTQKGITKIGIDPSNVASMQKDSDIKVVNTFFSYNALKDVLTKRASIITCCAMFYDLDNPNAFLNDVKKILDPNGLFVIQMNYLGLMIKNKTYDDICSEHREYYSFRALENLLDRNGFEVIDAELNDVNGGSIRAYIKHKGGALAIKEGSSRLEKLRSYEMELGLDNPETFKKFASDIISNKEKILSFIDDELKNNKVFHIRGASTRGLTQVQFLNLSKKHIKFAEDENPRKWGRYYADTRLKIISPEEAKGKRIDYKIVLPYHFIMEIANHEKPFLQSGGKLIVTIPEFRVI